MKSATPPALPSSVIALSWVVRVIQGPSALSVTLTGDAKSSGPPTATVPSAPVPAMNPRRISDMKTVFDKPSVIAWN